MNLSFEKRFYLLVVLLNFFLYTTAYADTIKCGTPFLKTFTKSYISTHLNLKLSLPSNLKESLETTNFKIYYTKDTTSSDCVLNPTKDDNGNNIPDYVDDVGTYLEKSYNYIINTLSYQKPPFKNYQKYRVFIANLSGIYGYCDYEDTDGDGTKDDTIIALHNTMSIASPNEDPEGTVKGALKVTIAHELFHAVKASYDWYEDLWWDEATSVWMEDEIYTSVNDYIRYLNNWFSHPEYSLDKGSEDPSDIHKYGDVIFAKFLSEKFNVNIIKNIWVRCATAGKNSLSSIKSELISQGSDFNTIFKNFTLANYTKDYKEGVKYPNIKTSSFQVNTLIPTTLTVNFDGDDNIEWGAKIVKENVSGTKEDAEINLDATKTGQTEITNFGEVYNKVILIVSNLSENQDKTYSYTTTNINSSSTLNHLASSYISFQPSYSFNVSSAYNFPNPCQNTTTFSASLTGHTPDRVVICIYNLAGELIETMVDSNPASNIQGNNYSCQKNISHLPNGVYIYQIEIYSNQNRVTKRGKMAVLR